jgi:hypothetical protein
MTISDDSGVNDSGVRHPLSHFGWAGDGRGRRVDAGWRDLLFLMLLAQTCPRAGGEAANAQGASQGLSSDR